MGRGEGVDEGYRALEAVSVFGLETGAGLRHNLGTEPDSDGTRNRNMPQECAIICPVHRNWL